MGGNFSILDDDYDDDYGNQKRSTKPVPHRRLSTTKILDALSNTFRHWQEIVVNMRESRLPDDEAQPYLFQEMLTTRDTLNNILQYMSPNFMPHKQVHKPKQEHKTPKTQHHNVPKSTTLQRDLERYRDQNEIYKAHTDELTLKYLELNSALEKLDEERKDILLRLSQVTGNKLKSENPNVADLGDPNRPTKLGEMISELYDNEWTDAFEGLQRNGRNDRSSIRILLETFMDAFAFCYNERIQILRTSECKTKDLHDIKSTGTNRVRLKRTTSTVDLPTETSQHKQTETDCSHQQIEPFLFYEWLDKNAEHVKLSKDCGVQRKTDIYRIEDFHKRLQSLQKESNKKSQELLKEYGERLEPLIEQAYLETRWTSNCIKSLKPYIIKCLYVSWMMCVQTPPMAVAKPAKSGSTFGSAMYKQYTVKGPCVDYIVWPAILLHENGPVISKGVAQEKEI